MSPTYLVHYAAQSVRDAGVECAEMEHSIPVASIMSNVSGHRSDLCSSQRRQYVLATTNVCGPLRPGGQLEHRSALEMFVREPGKNADRPHWKAMRRNPQDRSEVASADILFGKYKVAVRVVPDGKSDVSCPTRKSLGVSGHQYYGETLRSRSIRACAICVPMNTSAVRLHPSETTWIVLN